MSKKRGLGRGLNALIPSEPEPSTIDADGEEAMGVRHLAISTISPNPLQPRTRFAEDSLAELAASIREHGLIQPLIVTQARDGYTLIAGERRWRAAQLANLTNVPVIIKEATPQEMLELALIENIQRADLNPLEEAFAYQQLIDEFNLTQDEVSKRVGKGRSTVANLLRLLSLPDNIKQAVTEEHISGAHARALLPLPTGEMQTAAMSQVMKLSLSVRQTETLVKNLLSEKRPTGEKKAPTLPAELLSLQSEFEHRLGTRVAIQKGPKGGRVVIYYYSDDDLQAVYEAIVGSD